jgi:acyl-CoA reductase-like NAD-dependent aldehyde dehydrogenase
MRFSSTMGSAIVPGRALTSPESPKRRKKNKLGPGLDERTEMGPLVSEEQFNRVCGYLESSFADGAKATTGGKRIGDKGYFVEPTVLYVTFG